MADERIPSVIASDVEITYRVYGGGGSGGLGDETSEPTLRRWLRRGREHVGGTRTVHAVRGVSFVAHKGESIGIIGRNGSGKSTLLRSIAGLVPPTSGEVYVNGTVALLGVKAVLLPKLSGARNVMVGGQALGLTRAEVRERYDEIVEFAGVGDAIDLPMQAYSSGMGARLAFAISTAAVPDVLVVDEALSTGDADFKARADERIRAIRDAAGTVFVVSHSNATISRMCDRVIWLDRGVIRMDGPTKQVMDAYAQSHPPAKKKPTAKKAPAKKASPKKAPATPTPSAEA